IYSMSVNDAAHAMCAIRPNAMGDITLKPGTETKDFVPWSTTRGGSMTPTPIVYGDYLYSINVSGIVGCYDARTGARQYFKRLEHGGSGFSASAVAADRRSYFPSAAGAPFAVQAGPTVEPLSNH